MVLLLIVFIRFTAEVMLERGAAEPLIRFVLIRVSFADFCNAAPEAAQEGNIVRIMPVAVQDDIRAVLQEQDAVQVLQELGQG